MKTLKTILIFMLTLLFIAIICLIYGFKIEPYMLKTENYQLKDKNIESIKIVHISDTHIKADYDEHRLEKIVEEVNREQGDIVVFTGDLFDNYQKYGDEDLVASYLENIEAKYGKFAIWGNHDYGGRGKRAYEKVMDNSGFKILKNSGESIDIEDNKLYIYGLDDNLFGNPIYENTEKNYDYKIILSHEQQFVIENNIKADLILTGHTHGGQINLPIINEMSLLKRINPTLMDKYIKGMYSLENGKLFVNSGIGTTVMSARFNVKPEISVIEISKP